MKPSATSGPRRKSRVGSLKHDPTVADAAATESPEGGTAKDVHARITSLAFQRYEQRGHQDGHDLEDWLIAEQRVLAGRNFQAAGEKWP